MPFNDGRPEFVRMLCEIADQDPEPVLKNTIMRLATVRYELNGEALSGITLLRQFTKFCPRCLMENDKTGEKPNTHRREHLAWRFVSVHVCPKHHIILRTDDIKSAGRWDPSMTVPFSREGLARLSDQCMAAKPPPLQSYLLDRVAGGKGPDWLDGQKLDNAVRDTEMLGAILEFGYRADIDNMSSEDWIRAGRAGWEYTSRGETAVQAAFYMIQAETPKLTNKPEIKMGYRFGQLYHWLTSKSAFADPGPMRDLLRKHIIMTEPITTDRKILGEKVLKNRVRRPKPQKFIRDSTADLTLKMP